jgi:BirA family biotin operon repressor/biotin-[acetyl-CoA-carboxylase] ligase
MVEERLSKEECIRGLTTRTIGKVINFHESVTSTNDIAIDLAQGGAKEGTVVIANSQSRGQGRAGREFSSPNGGLYLSIILKPPLEPDEISSLPLVIGLSVSKAIQCTIFKEAKVKWPNDILVEDRKVAGILMSSKTGGRKVDHVVVGIGINLNTQMEDLPSELRDTAGSLKKISGKHIDPNEFTRDLLYLLDLNYSRFLEGQKEELLDQWSERAPMLGKEISVSTSKGILSGKALGIDQSGALILQTKKGMERIDSGDCHIL